jgi:undecaprenol kinase
MTVQPEINEPAAVKNGRLVLSFRYAWEGIKASWKSERNFRIHLAALSFVIVMLTVTRPHAVWWAVFLVTCGAVVAAELINTAVEKLVDHLHPDQHETIKLVKDTMAAAVLVLCVAAVIVLVAFLAALAGL